MWAFITGIIGVSLPKTINFINGLEETAFYGYLASYSFSAVVFWIFTKDFTFMTERESHFNQIKNIVKKLKEIKNDNRRRT